MQNRADVNKLFNRPESASFYIDEMTSTRLVFRKVPTFIASDRLIEKCVNEFIYCGLCTQITWALRHTLPHSSHWSAINSLIRRGPVSQLNAWRHHNDDISFYLCTHSNQICLVINISYDDDNALLRRKNRIGESLNWNRSIRLAVNSLFKRAISN